MKKLFNEINADTEVNTSVIVGKDNLNLACTILLPLAIYTSTASILYLAYLIRKKMIKGH